MKIFNTFSFTKNFLAFFLVIIVLIFCPKLSAQLPYDPTINTPIATGNGQQDFPAIIADGSGGAPFTITGQIELIVEQELKV